MATKLKSQLKPLFFLNAQKKGDINILSLVHFPENTEFRMKERFAVKFVRGECQNVETKIIEIKEDNRIEFNRLLNFCIMNKITTEKKENIIASWMLKN